MKTLRLASLLCACLILTQTVSATQAATPGVGPLDWLPGRSTLQEEPPPRPPLPPLPPAEQQTRSGIARIALVVGPWRFGLACVVQWQDGLGTWHDVEGWRSTLTHSQTDWSVEEKDFGTGPFRWMVYDQKDGSFVAATTSFNLPERSALVVVARLSLQQADTSRSRSSRTR